MAGGMVGGHEPLMPQAPFRHPAWLIGPGLAAAGILLVMTVAGLAALFWQAPLPALAELWQQPYLRRVLTFTLWQATLSTLLSLAVGLARRHGAGPPRGIPRSRPAAATDGTELGSAHHCRRLRPDRCLWPARLADPAGRWLAAGLEPLWAWRHPAGPRVLQRTPGRTPAAAGPGKRTRAPAPHRQSAGPAWPLALAGPGLACHPSGTARHYRPCVHPLLHQLRHHHDAGRRPGQHHLGSGHLPVSPVRVRLWPSSPARRGATGPLRPALAASGTTGANPRAGSGSPLAGTHPPSGPGRAASSAGPGAVAGLQPVSGHAAGRRPDPRPARG